MDSENDFIDSPMTTWDFDFIEGFWFSIYCAHNDSQFIDKIISIDFSEKGVKKYLLKLIKEFQNGELPSDDLQKQVKYDNEL